MQMVRNFIIFPTLLLLVLLSFSCTHSQNQKTSPMTIDLNNPETIDPFAENIGDHLDVNIIPIQKKAAQEYAAGNYLNAARYYLALTMLNVTDSNSAYNLACCYGLLEKPKLAADFLERAVLAGFDDIEHIKADPDFAKVRDTKVFREKMLSITAYLHRDKELEPRVVQIESGAFFNSYVRLPENFNPKTRYPLIVGLHGWGSSGESFVKIWDMVEHKDFIYVSPQAPYAFSLGKRIGYSWGIMQKIDKKTWAESTELAHEYVLNVVKHFKREYMVSDVFLVGFSQGAGLTLEVGLRHPKYFSGILAFGGWLNEKIIHESHLMNAKNLRVFIGHGIDDTRVPYEGAVKARELLEKHKLAVTFFDFDGGHSIPLELRKEAIDWMGVGK